MNILGISAYYHDAAACLVRDGTIVAAAQEERFTRRKHDESFPKNAIQFCLESQGIDRGEIDAVAFYDKPIDIPHSFGANSPVCPPSGSARPRVCRIPYGIPPERRSV